VIVLPALATPVLGLKTGMPSIKVVPTPDGSRVGYTQVQQAFGIGAPGAGGSPDHGSRPRRRRPGTAGITRAMSAKTPLVIGVVSCSASCCCSSLQAPILAAAGVLTNLLATGAAFGVARLVFQDRGRPGRADGLRQARSDRGTSDERFVRR
jgi:RND superfamily putative drug exporter